MSRLLKGTKLSWGKRPWARIKEKFRFGLNPTLGLQPEVLRKGQT